MVGGASLTGTKALASTAAMEEQFKLQAGTLFDIECSGSTLNAILPEIGPSNRLALRAGELTQCRLSVEEACQIEGSRINIGSLLAEATLQGTLAIQATFKPEKDSGIFSWKIVGAECAADGKSEIGGKLTMLAPTGQDERTSQRFQWNVTSASEELQPNVAVVGAALFKLATGEPWSFL
jgi:hypothetical protein